MKNPAVQQLEKAGVNIKMLKKTFKDDKFGKTNNSMEGHRDLGRSTHSIFT